VDKEENQKNIKTHEYLIIYQKTFDAAMTILNYQSISPLKKDILLPLKLDDRLVQFVLISPKEKKKV